MILHYLKVAVRSLLKYKVQSLISAVGLAAGFVCFALSMIWIRYELTYDDFHRGADRIYMIYGNSILSKSGYSLTQAYPLAEALRETFPEVEDAAAYICLRGSVEVEGRKSDKMLLTADSSFVRMFDVRLLNGSWSFLKNTGEVALTEEAALSLFGTKDILGKTLTSGGRELKISALVSGWGKHSNLHYDLMQGVRLGNEVLTWNFSFFTVCHRLREGVDEKVFAEKLENHDFNPGGGVLAKGLRQEKLMRCHYTLLKDENSFALTYIQLFAAVGALVIFMALINYFSLMVTRIRIRTRELGLRVVCGSSKAGLSFLFGMELAVLMLVSGFLGMVFIEWAEPKFCELSQVTEGVMSSAAGYFVGVFVVSLLLAAFLIVRYTRRSLVTVLQGYIRPDGRGISIHQWGIGIQLFFTLLILFTLSVLFVQLHYLKHTYIGFERDGKVTFLLNDPQFIHDLRELPYVYEVQEDMYSLLPNYGGASVQLTQWEGKAAGSEPIKMLVIDCDRDFIDFYGIRLLAGECQFDEPNEIVINETAAKALGWADPVGKKVEMFTVTGVFQDIHTTSPTVPVNPMMLVGRNSTLKVKAGGNIVASFDEKHADDLKAFYNDWMSKHMPQWADTSLCTANDVYDEYLTSEHALSRLLVFVSLVCVLISLFGLYSHIVLACERRRKEIAIRRVNGARVADILALFVREHLLLLSGASIVAFPVGYVLMRHWLERYVEQTPIAWWIYVGIFAVMALLISLCIGRSVWRAANENPAEVVKRE